MLTTFKEHPDAWTRVDTILEFSQNQQTKYYALQILENVIKTQWKVLPRQQCEGSGFIFDFWSDFSMLCQFPINMGIINYSNYSNFNYLIFNYLIIIFKMKFNCLIIIPM